MADPLNVATSGLVALQRAVSTTGNNIVNVNTEGYSRQTISFSQQPVQNEGRGYIGNGVTAGEVRRSYDQFLVGQVQAHRAATSSLTTVSDLAGRLDSILADPATGLNQNLSNFFGAMHAVANNPTSTPERRVLLAEAEALATQVQFMDDSLAGFTTEVNNRLQSVADEVNELAANIAHMNGRIVALTDFSTGNAPMDLLDQRDLLLTELSEKVEISLVSADDGSVNVFIAAGQPIVVGTVQNEITTVPNLLDTNQVDIVFRDDPSGGGINDRITGGELKGLIDFNSQILNHAKDQLGLLAIGITESINEQHSLGLNLDGNFGSNFFVPTTVATVGHPLNTGSATLTASIQDVSQLEASEYTVRYDGTNWQIIRESDQQTTSTSGSTSIDGLDLVFAGGPAVAGDTFVIRAARDAASHFELSIGRPADIAAASPLTASSSDANLGDARFSNLQPVITAPLASPVQFAFDPDALGAGIPGFVVTGAVTATIAYDPTTDSAGKEFNLAGVGIFELSGVPASADTFTVNNSVSGSGDNLNAIRLSELQNIRLLDNDQMTLEGYFGSIISDVGVGARQAEVNANTESVLLQQAEAARDSVSGVNLDEEAANLLKLQQAYQAAAQVVGIADAMFQSLLFATGR